MDTLTLKCHNSFHNLNNRKATHSFATRSLIFKLQQEVLKFNYICVSWSYPKTDLVTNFNFKLQTSKLQIEVLRTLVFLNSNF